jgi:hypothetical protein
MVNPKKEAPSLARIFEQERRKVLAGIKGEVIPYEQSDEMAIRNRDKIDWDANHLQLDYEIRIEKRERRKKWDKSLLWLVILGFAASYLMIILIGTGVLSFPDNSFAVPSVVAAGVIETYGLARIAARYFFSEDNQNSKPKK